MTIEMTPVMDETGTLLSTLGHADLIRESIDGLVGEDPPG